MPSLRVLTVVIIRAVTLADWRGKAGERFRSTVDNATELASSNGIHGDSLMQNLSKKVDGVAAREHATATKEYAEAEAIAVQTELHQRAMEDDLRKRKAEADIAVAQARSVTADALIRQMEVVAAEVRLMKELAGLGVALVRLPDGTFGGVPANGEYLEVVKELARSHEEGSFTTVLDDGGEVVGSITVGGSVFADGDRHQESSEDEEA